MICAFICLLCLAGCDRESKTVAMDLNFEASQVQKVEMYHYIDSPASAEKKVITDPKDIQSLYAKFQGLKMENKQLAATPSSAEVTSFRFLLEDGTNFELIYYGYGVKNGELCFSPSNHRLFTAADIGWNWRWLNEDLEAVPAGWQELPQS